MAAGAEGSKRYLTTDGDRRIELRGREEDFALLESLGCPTCALCPVQGQRSAGRLASPRRSFCERRHEFAWNAVHNDLTQDGLLQRLQDRRDWQAGLPHRSCRFRHGRRHNFLYRGSRRQAHRQGVKPRAQVLDGREYDCSERGTADRGEKERTVPRGFERASLILCRLSFRFDRCGVRREWRRQRLKLRSSYLDLQIDDETANQAEGNLRGMNQTQLMRALRMGLMTPSAE